MNASKRRRLAVFILGIAVMGVVILAAPSAQAHEPGDTYEVPCYAASLWEGPGEFYLSCELDDPLGEFGTVGIGRYVERLFVRAFVRTSFVAADVEPEGYIGQAGRFDRTFRSRGEHVPGIDVWAACVYHGPASYITVSCSLEHEGEVLRFFLGHHRTQLFASVWMPQGWAAAWIGDDQVVGYNGHYA